jgi:hypothetical protein
VRFASALIASCAWLGALVHCSGADFTAADGGMDGPASDAGEASQSPDSSRADAQADQTGPKDAPGMQDVSVMPDGPNPPPDSGSMDSSMADTGAGVDAGANDACTRATIPCGGLSCQPGLEECCVAQGPDGGVSHSCAALQTCTGSGHVVLAVLECTDNSDCGGVGHCCAGTEQAPVGMYSYVHVSCRPGAGTCPFSTVEACSMTSCGRCSGANVCVDQLCNDASIDLCGSCPP